MIPDRLRTLAAAADRLPWRDTLILGAICFLLSVSGGWAARRPGRNDAIRIVAGELPPQLDAAGTGREAEIVTAVLGKTFPNRPIEFHIVPFTRHWAAYQRDSKRDGRYDAVLTVPTRLELGGFASLSYIAYQNGIIYRKTDFPRGLGPHPLADLRGKRVVAFGGAAALLPEIMKNIPLYLSYAEYEDQFVHSMMLARNAVDAVIADRLIVDAYDRRILGPRYRMFSSRLAFDRAFCPSYYHAVFRTDAMRNAFDAGLAQLRRSGELDRINARYAGRPAIDEHARLGLECS